MVKFREILKEELHRFNPQCHAELVSAPHMLSVLHASHPAYGIGYK